MRLYFAAKETTLAALSREVDCSAGYLSSILNGKRIAGRKMARAVEKASGGDIQFSKSKPYKIEKVKIHYPQEANQ